MLRDLLRIPFQQFVSVQKGGSSRSRVKLAKSYADENFRKMSTQKGYADENFRKMSTQKRVKPKKANQSQSIYALRSHMNLKTMNAKLQM